MSDNKTELIPYFFTVFTIFLLLSQCIRVCVPFKFYTVPGVLTVTFHETNEFIANSVNNELAHPEK